MKYFENCKSIEEAKALYRKLAVQYHPDSSGSSENAAIFAEISIEYKEFCKKNSEYSNDEVVDEFLKSFIDVVFDKVFTNLTVFKTVSKILNFDIIDLTKLKMFQTLKKTKIYNAMRYEESEYFRSGEAFKDLNRIVLKIYK